MPKAANRKATIDATIYSGNQLAIATPNTTAKMFKKVKAAIAPSMIGVALCRDARVMQTSWLLSPISAAAISVKLVTDEAKISVVLSEVRNDK